MKTIRIHLVHAIFILMVASPPHLSFAQAPPRDDTNWQPYNIGADGPVFTLHSNPAYFPRHMYVGGSFTMIEGRPAYNIARFNTEFWESLGQGVDGYVFAIATSSYPWNGVFVGGQFGNAINPDGSIVPASNIAFWDNSQRKWFPVGNGVDHEVLTLALGGIGGSTQLFAGGFFTRALDGPTLSGIGKFDLYTNTWTALGNGVADTALTIVRSIVIAPMPSVGNSLQLNMGLVYVGGRFMEATNPDGSKTLSPHIMLWNNVSERWQPLGNGASDEVLALALGPNNSLYAGGRFGDVMNTGGSRRNVNFIALWNGLFWEALGNGLNAAVTAIAPSFDLNRIFVGGEFSEAVNSDGVSKPANKIAVFNRYYHPHFAIEWDVFGSGVNGYVDSILPVRPCPPGSASEVLHAGGSFIQAGNKNSPNIAKWKYSATVPPPIGFSKGLVLSTSRSRGSGNSRRSRVSSQTLAIPPCLTVIGKSSESAEEILFDNLGFREAADLPALPYLQPLALRAYDVENLATPTTTLDVEITTLNPQLLVLMGVDDTTAYARNPEGFYTGETVMLHDLPLLTNNPGEVRTVFVHAVTDAPAIDIVTTAGDTLVRNLRYGAVSNPISIAAGNHTVDLIRRQDRQKLGTHTFDVSNQANGYASLALSGFLDPAANQNGPAMELGVYGIPSSPTTSIGERDETAPESFQLFQNHPNPFNPETSIRYSVDSDQFVSLKVYDLLGREVATLVNERKPAGAYRVSFEAGGLSSGVYFVKMRAGGFVSVKKMLLMR